MTAPRCDKKIDWTKSYGLRGSYDCAMMWKEPIGPDHMN